ncbi:hypothetical protein [Dysgonomonas sp. 521]|uniref:hypothetical protein n=1 Tax=Dysgonomonas sp. 521 TaxID=2302932 RepID=UPI001625170C|nr:hypothetical protein [Dysgonomonas sp. 521]
MKLYSILTIMSLLSFLSCSNNDSFNADVRNAIKSQMEKYPESTLKDIYKNFFQDRFGPGHLIEDVEQAHHYLHHELTYCLAEYAEAAEPTGWQHNFYRVNLGIVQNEIISCDALLEALIRSANAVKPFSVEDWQKEWSEIEAIIKAMNLSLPNYDEDKKEIDARLEEGKYIGHHSDAYNIAYDPHYRIISKKIYEEEILPLINNIISKSGMKFCNLSIYRMNYRS